MSSKIQKFKRIENKSFPEMEAEVLKFWKDKKVFEKSVASRAENERYVFYDGPPFISGLPHYGHLLGSIAKDIIPRYWTMKGRQVERVWGWDAHGLTVENKVQKELGIKSRRDIESYGLEKFTKACYKYTSKISAEWEWYIDRVGRWVDFKNAYKTIDQSYMESVIWVFKQLYDKGLIYEGTRTSLYCTTCGTPVSNFEIAMDNSYKEVKDPSVIVKFPVISTGKFNGASLLAWTTTPWTLPSNRALVIDKKKRYVLVGHNNDKYIIAKDRVTGVFKDQKISLEKDFIGEELLGLKYKPLYEFFKAKRREFQVYSYEGMVDMQEGTGVVHSAPGFGGIDTDMGRHYDLSIMLVINNEGKFVAGDNGTNPFEGMFYKKADKYIQEDLRKRGLLFREETIVHRFPYHDRCNTNLIQRAQRSWFIKVSSLKNELLKNNEKINWMPSHLKYGRFAKGIQQAPDWCISRTRFWATPMPVWESKQGDRIVVSSVKELEKLSGQKITDLHRPYIDNIVIKKNGRVYKRRGEVLDSWFEAGSMPYAQIHYPFENKKKFEESFPGDYVVEYVGQVRAWFYVMHVLSTALFSKSSFKNVISTGIMSGNDGRKMSKTYGNYTDPRKVIEKVGGDALRLYLMNSPLMVGGNANFDYEELRNKSRNVLNPLWNSVKYFLIYASLNKWDPSSSVVSRNTLDRWVVIELHKVISKFSKSIEDYNIPSAIEPIECFVNDLSNWYIRRSRDRLSSGDNEALSTLYEVLSTFSKAVAPVVPFIAESMYKHLVSSLDKTAPESVHLCSYPEADEMLMSSNKKLLEEMHVVRKIASLGNAIRKEIKIPVRQPLSEMQIIGLKKLKKVNLETLSTGLLNLLKDELNVKRITIVDRLKEKVDMGKVANNTLLLRKTKWVSNTAIDMWNVTVALNVVITEDLKREGYARELIREIQKLRKKADVAWNAKVKVQYKESEKYKKAIGSFYDEIKLKTLAIELLPGEDFRIL